MAKPASSVRSVEAPFTEEGWLINAQDGINQEHNLGLFRGLKMYPMAVFWSIVMSTSIVMEGYDTMLIGSLVAQPAFQKRYGLHLHGSKYEIPASWQAGLNNASGCGQLVGLLIAGYVSEQLGFRKTMTLGLGLASATIFIIFFAPTIGILTAGECLFGIPLGLFQTIPVVYAMEISPMCLRPYLTTYVNFCWAIGHLIGAGILRGTLSLDNEWSYRIPFAIQWFWPLVLIPLLYFAPESPWWLVRQDRLQEAKDTLKRLTSVNEVDFNIEKAVSLIVVTTAHERAVNASTTYLACFKGTDLTRTLISIGVYCIQTLSGNPLRGYSTFFFEQAGLSSTEAFNMSIGNYALALFGSFFSWALLPLFGRRSIYFWSLIMMLVLMVMIGALGVPQAKSPDPAYSWAIGSLLIISSFLYNSTSGPLTNTICSEIPSTLLRSKSLVLARWTYAVTSIVASILTSYQLTTSSWNWGAKTGFFWAGGCLISAVFAYLCVPETKARTTAEMDILFERKVSLRHFSQTPVNLVHDIGEKDEESRH